MHLRTHTEARIARALCFTLGLFSGSLGLAVAAEDPVASAKADDFDRRMRDFDTQMRNIINTPVDFCDPEALSVQMKKYYGVHLEQFRLKFQREKLRPTLRQAANTAAATLADEGFAVDDPQIVETYKSAMKRGDTAGAKALMARMAPWEQEQAAEWSHDNALAFKILTPMADSGDVKAQRRLAIIYSWQTNLDAVTRMHATAPLPPRDDALAFKYARLASLKGDEIAQEVLAKAYACGLGTQKDLVKAYAWFSLAVSQSALMLSTDDQPKQLLRRRDFLAGLMSHEEIQRAKHLLINCYQSQYKQCD